MEKIKAITFLDIVLIIGLITTSFFIRKAINNVEMGKVIVYIDNNIYAKYDLHTDMVYKIKGALGYSNLIIKNRSVKLIDSPCTNQICVKTGKISNPSNQIVCAPGHIMVRIESKKNDNEVDGIVQ